MTSLAVAPSYGASRGSESVNAGPSDNSKLLLWIDALLGDKQLPEEAKRAIIRVRTAAIRGGAAGIVIKGLHHVLLMVASLLSQARGKKRRTVTLYEAATDTAVYTAFLACMGGVYTVVDEGLALGLGKDRCVRVHWNGNSLQSYQTSRYDTVAAGAARVSVAHQLQHITQRHAEECIHTTFELGLFKPANMHALAD